jgi:hypothetical protein
VVRAFPPRPTRSGTCASLRRVIAAFGPKRAFWGSDITRVPASCRYRQTVTHVTERSRAGGTPAVAACALRYGTLAAWAAAT